MEQAKNKQRVGALDMSKNTQPFLNPKKAKPEADVEYLVITNDQCFYTAFFNPMGMKGWVDVSTNKHLKVVGYQPLPDVYSTLLAIYKSTNAVNKALESI